jgi:hypothetical protein
MFYAIYENGTTGNTNIGYIYGVGYCPDGQEAGQAVLSNQSILTSATPITPNTYYVTNYPSSPTLSTLLSFTTSNSWNTTSIPNNGTTQAIFGSSLPNPTTASIAITNSPTTLAYSRGSPATVYMNQTITDGSLVMTSTVAGLYTVTLSAFPYQTYTATITVTT